MAILAECPICHKKQAVKNKRCNCGAELEKLKRAKEKVRYWISYRLPGGKQRREPVGFSIWEARDADGKRRVQKRENRIFDIKPEAKMTFKELSEWYLGLEKVKAKAYYPTLTINLNSFLSEFGSVIVGRIKPADLENYQAKRKKEGYSDSYVDHEVGAARTMLNKAFDNDMVGADTLKVFKRVKKLLRRNANARDRILTAEEASKLMAALPLHTRTIIAIAAYTGMRKSEILSLTWDKLDLKQRTIRLEAADTKDREPRKIPISEELYGILRNIPKAIHDNHVILYMGKPVKDIRSALTRACKDTGITYGRFAKGGFVLHDMRHTFNTNMRKAGVAQSVIMKITGHSTSEMFERYNTVDDSDIRQAAARLDNFMRTVDQNVDQVTHQAAINETRD